MTNEQPVTPDSVDEQIRQEISAADAAARAALPLVTLGIPAAADGTEEKSESTLTVIIAFGANLLVAIAKTWAAMLTGSASLVAEAAHSWADTGNEVFLIIANRMSRRPADRSHPLGFGREAYVWSLFAALGLFVAGSVVSIQHGISELFDPEPATDYLVGYIVLGISFLLEGFSFLQSVRQARREAGALHRDLLDHVLATSDPTLRAVFAEDAAALTGLLIATAGLGLHQLTGSPTPDAIGSILVGVLLGFVAVILINRNRRFLVGQEVSPAARSAALAALLSSSQIDRVTALRLEFVGPRQVYVVADVDLTGDDSETHLAIRLRAMEAEIRRSPAVVDCTLSLSSPDEPALLP
ncbi:MAG: cation diffusion facilitator family transporter [Nakamurella sp.]